MITPWEILHRVQPLEVIAKAVAVTLAYLLGFAITSHFHEASSLTGAMLACVSAIVVQQQPDIRHAVQQGWLRVLGTFIGAVVAYVYLVNFRFSPAGMVVAVVLEEVICMMFKVPDNGKMATITLIIVLIVSERSPDLSPLANGLLRFSEATVGAVVGIAAVWPVDRYRRWRDMGVFVMIGVYAFSIIDAYVDASLSEFDISDDLTLRVEPAFMNSNPQSRNPFRSGALGLQCSLTF